MTWKNVTKTPSTLNLLSGLKIPVFGRSQSMWKTHTLWIKVVLLWRSCMRKDGLPAGACGRKDLLLSPFDCVSWNSSVSFGYLFPTYKTGELSMSFPPRHCPSTFDSVSTSAEAQRECSGEQERKVCLLVVQGKRLISVSSQSFAAE